MSSVEATGARPGAPAWHGWLQPAMLAGVALTLAIGAALDAARLGTGLSGLLRELPGSIEQRYLDFYLLNPTFYAVLGIILLLERVIPAAPRPAGSGAAVRQDLLWTVLNTLHEAALLPIYLLVLAELYRRYLDFLTIRSLAELPWAAKFAISVLLTDLIQWLMHWSRHKVPLLWHFHAVHHSQTHLSMFNEDRKHPFDAFVAVVVRCIPFMMTESGFVTLLTWEIVRFWKVRFLHANVAIDLGPLRYILVTPQFHRIHHSVDRRHADCNIGQTFVFWDMLFGTYRGERTYPTVGIEDPGFPMEGDAPLRKQPGILLAQLLYPFRAVARDVRAMVGRSGGA
jgi:sterol desaturase/sphingolipid hydroxylase (fatty acid hydroxylase superfamily)